MLEREWELEAISAALAAAQEGEGTAALVDAPAGVGKTTLMRAARDAATDSGMRLLMARGNELERPFGFGVVRQLLEPALASLDGDPADVLGGAARFAASVLDVRATPEPAEAPGDTFAIHNGIYWLIANLAADGPLAMLVDDLHWSDDESLEVFAHLVNRLEGVPVALILASRIEESRSGLEAVRRITADFGYRLCPSPLGRDAVGAVVRASIPDAADVLCDSCLEASGGNPFLLKELVRSLLEGESVDPASVLDGSPERVTRELGFRLSRLPRSARALACAAAVLGEGAPLRRVASLAELSDDDAAAAADSLVAAGVLREASPVEFLHPLVRAGIYAGIGPAARSSEHARAARILAADGEPPGRVATQLLRCEPGGDPWVLEQLLAAAADAGARGAPDAAASLLRRALAEPPPPEVRSRVLLELGIAEVAAVEIGPSLEHVREALAGEIPPERRTRGALLLAGMLGHSVRTPEAIDLLEEQRDALAEHPDLLLRTEIAMANLTQFDDRGRERVDAIRADLGRRAEDPSESDPGVLTTAATDLLFAAQDRDRVIELTNRALAAQQWETTYSALGWSRLLAVRTLSHADEFDAAADAVEKTLERALAVGASLDYGGCLTFRGQNASRVGDLAAAETDVRTALDLARRAGWEGASGLVASYLGEILVDRGEIDEAEAVLGVPEGADDPARGYSAVNVWFARGRCRMAQGRMEEAATELRKAGDRLTAVGCLNPAVVSWRSKLAIALLELDQKVEARRLAVEELGLARSFGAPRARSAALRVVARVEGGAEEIRLLGEAAEVIADSQALLERARVHAQLGTALRRERARPDAAREPLRLAIDLAHRCGARALENEALGELRATGARPRRRLASGAGALTPSERRIAELAASGRQNREIAESLFVTVDTVEFHLRNAYRKLGIAGRGELKDALAS